MISPGMEISYHMQIVILTKTSYANDLAQILEYTMHYLPFTSSQFPGFWNVQW